MAEYRNPKPTCDVIVELPEGVVLIERANEPRGFAIPGGFADEGEPIEVCGIREMKEEIGIDVVLTDLLYVYSDPRRDPRLHTVATVFIGRPKTAGDKPVAGDDAKAVLVVPAEKAPALVFDHDQILRDYVVFKRTRTRPDPMAHVERWRSR